MRGRVLVLRVILGAPPRCLLRHRGLEGFFTSTEAQFFGRVASQSP